MAEHFKNGEYEQIVYKQEVKSQKIKFSFTLRNDYRIRIFHILFTLFQNQRLDNLIIVIG